MIITEKMIRELQRRVNVSYEEAERLLRKAGGNIDIAQALAEKHLNSLLGRLTKECERLINATLIYRLKVYKEKDVFLNMPILFSNCIRYFNWC
jgi:Tfp pilus assembly PilM family ATPase